MAVFTDSTRMEAATIPLMMQTVFINLFRTRQYCKAGSQRREDMSAEAVIPSYRLIIEKKANDQLKKWEKA